MVQAKQPSLFSITLFRRHERNDQLCGDTRTLTRENEIIQDTHDCYINFINTLSQSLLAYVCLGQEGTRGVHRRMANRVLLERRAQLHDKRVRNKDPEQPNPRQPT